MHSGVGLAHAATTFLLSCARLTAVVARDGAVRYTVWLGRLQARAMRGHWAPASKIVLLPALVYPIV